MIRINQNAHLYGYVLGLPFLQALNVILDYDNNRVGFGNKRQGRQGAYLYGIPEPKSEDANPPAEVPGVPEKEN